VFIFLVCQRIKEGNVGAIQEKPVKNGKTSILLKKQGRLDEVSLK